MTLQWKDHEIDLGLFKIYLDENIPSSDGIVADPENFTIIETEAFSEEELSLILSYYETL